jgi:truncated hemoglobin YjbI
MTYFYAQLFTMDTEIRAMFPAAMDVQRRRFFAALSQIAAAQGSQEERDRLVPDLRDSGARTGSSASASATTRWSGGR